MRDAESFDWHYRPAEISWKHAKKKEDGDEAGDVERPGQGTSAQDHEEGARDQTPKEVNRDIRYLALTNEFLEVVLKNQADILEQLVQMAKALKILSDWAESNWTEAKIRGPESVVHNPS